MNNRRELTDRLVSTLKELERERQYRGLKRFVRELRRRKPLSGKEKFVLRGSSAYLRRLQSDRRAWSLHLNYIPYDEREDTIPEGIPQSDFRAWDRSVGLFMIGLEN